jgi:hypothetical protein
MSRRTVYNVVTILLLFASIAHGVQTARVSAGGESGGTGATSGAGEVGGATATAIGTPGALE